jgi:arylsulfatase
MHECGLGGKEASSRREGYLYWMGTELYGVKWRNFKLALTVQKYLTDPVGKLPFPHIINLTADSQEPEPLNLPCLHSRTATHFNRLLADYPARVKRETPIPAGAPLDFVPAQPPD